MSSLYSLTQTILALEALLDEADERGATDDETQAIVAGWFAEFDGDLATRLDAIARWRAERLSLAMAAKVEATRLTARYKLLEGRVDRMDDAVLTLMQAAKVPKVETSVATFSVGKAGGRVPVIIADDVDVEALPADCIKRTVAPVKSAIGDRLAAGETIPGCTLGERATILKVK